MTEFHLRDGAYLLLLAVSTGHRLTVHEDRVAIPSPTAEGEYLPVGEADLDDLEAAGLLATTGEGTEAGPVVTERGYYWLNRWLAARFKVREFRVAEVRLSRTATSAHDR